MDPVAGAISLRDNYDITANPIWGRPRLMHSEFLSKSAGPSTCAGQAAGTFTSKRAILATGCRRRVATCVEGVLSNVDRPNALGRHVENSLFHHHRPRCPSRRCPPPSQISAPNFSCIAIFPVPPQNHIISLNLVNACYRHATATRQQATWFYEGSK